MSLVDLVVRVFVNDQIGGYLSGRFMHDKQRPCGVVSTSRMACEEFAKGNLSVLRHLDLS